MPVTINDFSPHDQQILDEELQDFVPDRLFDAPIHMFHPEHLKTAVPSALSSWRLADFSTRQQWAARLYPDRETHFLVLGTPALGIDVTAHNRWCIDQVSQDPQSRMNRLVTRSCRVQDIERDVRERGFIGLKRYRLFSVTGDIAQCRIHEFLPHEQLELANELGLWVTMHLSRFHGCADEFNLDDLREFTGSRYPNIKWILAHCARSFIYWPILATYEQLLSMKHAAEIAQWSDDDVQNFFWRNAVAAFGVSFGDEAAPRSRMGEQTQATYARAKQLIPGGTQLLSKRPEMFAPGLWPAYAREAHGCEVIDLDGRRFIDMTTSGIGSCLLGYADPDVTAAVQRRIALGSMSTLNAAEEVELAELLIELHPWAEKVRYARSGGESMAVAVRIARAATGCDKIAFCGYDGWCDWYLAANVNPRARRTNCKVTCYRAWHQPACRAGLPGRRCLLPTTGCGSWSSTWHNTARISRPWSWSRLDPPIPNRAFSKELPVKHYHAMGIHSLEAIDNQDRPYNLLDEGKPLVELF